MLNNANSPRQRLTRRRRSSSATIHGHCHSLNSSPNSSTTTIAHDRHRSISPAAPPVVRRQRLDLDWRRSKRSASELAGLRFLVLSHIDELEKRLGTLESASATPCRDQSEEPSSAQAQPVKGDGSRSVRSPSPTSTVTSSRSTSVAPSSHSNARSPTRSRSSSVSSWTNDLNLPTWDSEFDFSAVDDLRTWVRESLDQLAHLRDEVSARLPDLEEIKGHLPEFEWDFDTMGLQADELLHEFRAKLSKVEVPNMAEMKTKIGDWGYEYLPTLSDHLSNLHARLTERAKEVEFHSKTFDRGNAVLRDFIDALMYNDEDSPTERKRVVDEVERTVLEVQHALEISEGGHQLISYHQLPAKWRNNEHVVSGYRFIPIQNWPTLLLSTFHLHNETANIHTHLLPLVSLVYLFGSEAYSSYLTSTSLYALPTTLFSLFSLLCLVTSVGWHIFAGCSSPKIMETAARVDYLGIGWLISASIATLVYYAFSCRTLPFTIYISMTIVAGLAGSVLPFMEWFNERKHKKWRIVFFLSLALTGFIPVLHLSILHGFQEALRYVAPISPSLASYVFGLCFYACHFPECLWTAEEANQGVYEHIHEGEKKIDTLHQHPRKRWTDHFGGGSHAIWHISIVVAIWLHRSAIPTLAEGLGGEQCDVWNRG